MTWVAIKMLVADPAKFAGLVFGVAFSTVLIAQQSAFCVGLINTAPGVLYEVDEADLWVMDPRVQSVDAPVPLTDAVVNRVRGVTGIAWATRYLKSQVSVEGAGARKLTASLIGVDEINLIGLPRGTPAEQARRLRQPGAIFVDEAGYKLLWPGEPPAPGRELEINECRVFVAGIVRAKPQFGANVILYAAYPTATRLAPAGRRTLSYVLAGTAEADGAEAVAARVQEQTGLKALTRVAFIRSTIGYVLRTTAIAQSFGLIVALGIVVGIVIVALTLSLFIRDNLAQFAAMRAIGVSRMRLMGMIGVQATAAAWCGYGLGMGLAAWLIRLIADNAPGLRTLFLPWEVGVITAGLQALVLMFSAWLAIRRVLNVDPASVFRT